VCGCNVIMRFLLAREKDEKRAIGFFSVSFFNFMFIERSIKNLKNELTGRQFSEAS